MLVQFLAVLLIVLLSFSGATALVTSELRLSGGNKAASSDWKFAAHTIIIFFLINASFIAHKMRRYVRQRKALAKQISDFSVRDASCFSEDDRVLVEAAISSWFSRSRRKSTVVGIADSREQGLDNFDRYVRTELKDSIMTHAGSDVAPAYRFLALPGVICFWMNLDYSCGAREFPLSFQYSLALVGICAWLFSPIFQCLCLMHARLFSRMCQNFILDCLLSFLLGLLYSTYLACALGFLNYLVEIRPFCLGPSVGVIGCLLVSAFLWPDAFGTRAYLGHWSCFRDGYLSLKLKSNPKYAYTLT